MKIWEIKDGKIYKDKINGNYYKTVGDELRFQLTTYDTELPSDDFPWDLSTRKHKELVKLDLEEYKEPEIDWSTIPNDTKVLVSNDRIVWYNRYFAGFGKSKLLCWRNGSTSWSVDYSDVFSSTIQWNYIKPYIEN